MPAPSPQLLKSAKWRNLLGILKVLSIFTILLPAGALAVFLAVLALIPQYSTVGSGYLFVVLFPIIALVLLVGLVIAAVNTVVIPLYLSRSNLSPGKVRLGWAAVTLSALYCAFWLHFLITRRLLW